LPRTRSSLFFAAAALLLARATAAADDPEVRRAAALLDYVARGYPTAVVSGRVINPAEFEEQQAFAQEAAEMLERLSAGKPFAAEARKLESEIRARAPFAEQRASSLHNRLLDAAGLTTTPPPELLAVRAPGFYEQSCAACHGADGRGDGFAAKQLTTPPTDFTGPDRAQLTPYRVYTAIRWGVPHTSMPAFEGAVTDQRLWEIALWVLTFGHDEADAQRGAEIARTRVLLPSAPELVARSDAELRVLFAPEDARALLAWVRRIAPFAPPPAAGFQELRNDLAMASVEYVHGRPQDAHARLRNAELSTWISLEPLVRAAAPGRSPGVREAFAAARAQVAELGGNTRVLGAVAQLSKLVAQAGPERLPEAAVQREAGALAALFAAWPALLALLAAALISRRWTVLLVPAGAGLGAALATGDAWTWQIGIAVWSASAAMFVLALAGAAAISAPINSARGSGLAFAARAAAVIGAALSAAAAGAEIAATVGAVRAVFPDAPLDLAYVALACAAAMGAAALMLAGLVRRAGRTAAALVLMVALAGSLCAAGMRIALARPFRAPAATSAVAERGHTPG
jgi:high-affinity iron transporter